MPRRHSRGFKDGLGLTEENAEGAGSRMLYAVGDIHGENEKLGELLDLLPLEENDTLVFLGDYVEVQVPLCL